jgi:MFS family permease
VTQRRPGGFAEPLRSPEFRALWLADGQAATGDQLTRIALAVLAYRNTHSALLTALIYAATFIPPLFGSALLSGLADRYPRRRVLIVANLVRMVLVAATSTPALPLPILFMLVFASGLASTPFDAANSALLADIFDDQPDTYSMASALRNITHQVAQLFGFGLGGLLLTVLGPAGCLRIDAATFAVATVLIYLGVKPRPAAAAVHGLAERYLASILTGSRLVFTSPDLRTLACLAWLIGLYVIPEGVAAPYAAHLHVGPAGLGLLMAANPTGMAIGAALYRRFLPVERCRELIGVLAAAAGLPLLGCALHAGLAVSAALWFVSGASCCYMAQLMPEYTLRTPVPRRGQAIGVAASGLQAAQGVGVLLGGLLASVTSPAIAVAVAGATGSALAVPLARAWRHQLHPATPATPGLGLVSAQA